MINSVEKKLTQQYSNQLFRKNNNSKRGIYSKPANHLNKMQKIDVINNGMSFNHKRKSIVDKM